MKRFLGLLAILAASSAVASACGSEGSTSGGATNETPDPTNTPGNETPAPTSTPSAGDVIRFVAIGDTGTGSETQHQVAAAIGQKCLEDGCDFGMLLGDNFYNTGVESVTDPQWADKFEEPYGGLPFPFYVVLGNHDYGGEGTGWEFDKGMIQVEYSQQNQQYILPAPHYTFEEGPANFVALDTNLIFWNYDDAPQKQGEFVDTVLAGATHPWRIVLGHHPYLSNGKHGNAGEYDGLGWWSDLFANGHHVRDFVEEHLCGNIDLYLSGHDHSRQILPGTESCPMTFVVSGAGAKTTELPGDNPRHFQADTPGFAYLVVSQESIVIEMIDAAGASEFTYTILAD